MADPSIARVLLKGLLLIWVEEHLHSGSGQRNLNAKAIAGKHAAFLMVEPDRFLLEKKTSNEQNRKLSLGMGILFQVITITISYQGIPTSLNKSQPHTLSDVKTLSDMAKDIKLLLRISRFDTRTTLNLSLEMIPLIR